MNTQNIFVNALVKSTNIAHTENGAISNASTLSYVLDLFSQIGALRNGVGAKARIDQFEKAFAENPELTLKTLFWVRDVRGGAGERDTFRIFMSHLVSLGHGWMIRKNLSLIPEYGRWDDLWIFLDIPELRLDVIDLIKSQLKKDACAERPSLLAKWLPSENASSLESKRLARIIRTGIGLSSQDYRKVLSGLRSTINIVEKKMSSRQWDEINYEHVPSRAAMLYKDAFKKNDEVRYTKYLVDVSNGEKKINAGTLFPYEIIKRYLRNGSARVNEFDSTLEALWTSLPNYVTEFDDSLVIADTSSSMDGTPMEVSISLAMYMAERNKGPWHNLFINFDDNPTLNRIVGDTLQQKLMSICGVKWGGSTNIEAAFDLILNTAVQNNLTQDQLVKRLFIVSDMEFNQASRNGYASIAQETLFRTISKKFEDKGYTMPSLVFWNVRASNAQFPMSLQDSNFVNISGSSPSILRYMFTGVKMDAVETMLSVLNSERYAPVKI